VRSAKHAFQRGAHRAHRFLRLPGGAADLGQDHGFHHRDACDHAHGDAEQDNIQERHEHQRGECGQGGRDRGNRGVADDCTQQRGVYGGARHQIAGFAAVQRPDGDPEQPADQALARVQHDAVRGPQQQVTAGRAKYRVGEHQQAHDHDQVREPAVAGKVVDQRPHDQRQHQAGRPGGQAQQRAGQQG
jgi:hypothetical protein